MVSSLVQLVTQIMIHRMIQAVINIDLKMLRITQNDPHGSRNNCHANIKCTITKTNKKSPGYIPLIYIFFQRQVGSLRVHINPSKRPG